MQIVERNYSYCFFIKVDLYSLLGRQESKQIDNLTNQQNQIKGPLPDLKR